MVPNKDVALLVIDMQNGFCKPKGSMGSLGFDISRCDSAIGQVRKLIDAAHKADVPVIYTRYVYQPGYKDGGILPVSVQRILWNSPRAALDRPWHAQPCDVWSDYKYVC